jgi:hypothetical protein
MCRYLSSTNICQKINTYIYYLEFLAFCRQIATYKNVNIYVIARLTRRNYERTMSTPGRKRVQPISIDDDDDDDTTSTSIDDAHVYCSSSSLSSIATNANVDNILSTLQSTAEQSSVTEPSSSPVNLNVSLPKKHIYVALNFDELSHIRNVQTNSEFATLLYDFQLYKTVVNGQICFSCRKMKLSFLQPGSRCAICLQRICHKCRRQMASRPDNICFVSLNLLRRSTTITLTSDMSIERNERSKCASSSTTNQIKTYPRTKLSNGNFSCCIDCFILFHPTPSAHV